MRAARLLAGVVALCAVPALAAASRTPAPATSASHRARGAAARRTTPLRPTRMTGRARLFYTAAWGVDRLRVKATAAGNLLRFTYRVVDPALATALADRGATPHLYGERSHALLEIPVLEKVGPLRQRGSAEPGRTYWMTFSNKGQLVRPGDRVDVMIGSFHADGLVVEGP